MDWLPRGPINYSGFMALLEGQIYGADAGVKGILGLTAGLKVALLE